MTAVVPWRSGMFVMDQDMAFSFVGRWCRPANHALPVSASDHQHLWCRLLHPGPHPAELHGGLALAGLGHVEEVLVPGALCGLAHHGPGDVALAGHEVE